MRIVALLLAATGMVTALAAGEAAQRRAIQAGTWDRSEIDGLLPVVEVEDQG